MYESNIYNEKGIKVKSAEHAEVRLLHVCCCQHNKVIGWCAVSALKLSSSMITDVCSNLNYLYWSSLWSYCLFMWLLEAFIPCFINRYKHLCSQHTTFPAFSRRILFFLHLKKLLCSKPLGPPHLSRGISACCKPCSKLSFSGTWSTKEIAKS